MSFATGLLCRECGTAYPAEARYSCEFCFGPLEVSYDLEAAKDVVTRASIEAGPRSIWRYGALLPDPGPEPVDLGAGWTPLRRASRLAEVLGVKELWLKDDTRNPTGSFKDRVVSVALSSARRLGFTTAACASTGNLATSVAAHAAFIGWPSVTIIPSDLEKSKIAMTAIFGGTVLGVEGNYDDVNRLCVELVAEHPDWAFANVNLRPYYAEGSKTLAFEICEQLGWTTPAQVVVPLASGSQFTKVAKGFRQFIELGLVEGDEPVLFGAQATGCSPIATALAEGAEVVTPQRPNTIARSLAIGNPADGPYVLDEVRAHGGDIGSVSDAEVLECIGLLAETEGVFAETAGGVTIASLRQMVARGTIDPEKSIVAIISGHGLKTLDAIVDTATVTSTITPSLAAAEEALGFHQLVSAS
ncbi:MAG: threonine synthase [Acidobacteriota bacterium]|nr:threonine synthase [Acidobacteriota bacterium]MDE3031297.1 threonine synthase [Acidobacteriota bacterium]MDE3092640.1 threonine synthase [Acidobacteriota bacterium]MDE3139161.1 threonine synthase [Acidobacteriota bacterium]MDE3146405.1 threonine synthase [Acidobacteriota bacterium]